MSYWQTAEWVENVQQKLRKLLKQKLHRCVCIIHRPTYTWTIFAVRWWRRQQHPSKSWYLYNNLRRLESPLVPLGWSQIWHRCVL